MNFEVVGEIAVVETIAAGTGIRDLKRLRKYYGKGRWRKMKGHLYKFKVLSKTRREQKMLTQHMYDM